VPLTRLVHFADPSGNRPVRIWFLELRLRDRLAAKRCVSKLRQLGALGYEARRPLVDHLGSGIYELRVRHGHVQFRILYGFGSRGEIVLLHAMRKERTVPPMDIRRAEHRLQEYLKDPDRHGYEEEADEEEDQ
jgi:phage-related protein